MPSNTKAKKGIIFDMDGTLIDNMMIHHRAWQIRLAQDGHEFSLQEVIEKCHGKNIEILERLFGNLYSPNQRLSFSNEKEEIYRDLIKTDLIPLPGLIDLLSYAYEHEIPMGIGTAAQYKNVDVTLDTLNIRNYFGAIVADTDVANGKPNPEVFLKVANMLGIEPQNALVFEDSPVGAHTAQNAGMKVIIMTTTHKVHEFDPFETVIKCVKDYTEIDLETELYRL